MIRETLEVMVERGILFKDDVIYAFLSNVPPREVVSGLKTDAAKMMEALEILRKTLAFRKLSDDLKKALLNVTEWELDVLFGEHEQVQSDFYDAVAAISEGYKGSHGEWKSRAMMAIFLLTLTQYALGRGMGEVGTVMDGIHSSGKVYGDIPSIKWRLMKEWEYLSKIPDLPPGYTSRMLAARLELYSGSARGLFYKVLEDRALGAGSDARERKLLKIPDQAVLTGGVIGGMIARYKCRNDKSSCKPCKEAMGDYLPGHGPLPGQVCQGQSRCRCARELVYDKDAWDRLKAEAIVSQEMQDDTI